MRLRAGLAMTTCLTIIGAFTGRTARADESAHCTLRSVVASVAPGGVDPRIADLAQKLTRAPFTEWKSFKLLTEHKLTLALKAKQTVELPEGRRGTITYMEHLAPQAGRHRVRLHLEIIHGEKSQLSTQFVLDEGGTVLTAGSRHADGMLILGVACATES